MITRPLKILLVLVLVFAMLGVIGVAQANASEATLTEIVEAVKADTAQVEAFKSEEHTDLAVIATLLKAPVPVTLTGEPMVRVAQPVEVHCATGCGSGGGVGEVELTAKAEAKLAEGNKESAVFIVGALCGLFLGLVFWVMIRPRNS